MTSLTQLFKLCLRVPDSGILSNIDIEKSLNSVSQTQIVTRMRTLHEIILIGHRPRFYISWAWDGRCSKENVLRGGSVRGTFVRTGGDC